MKYTLIKQLVDGRTRETLVNIEGEKILVIINKENEKTIPEIESI